MKREKFTTIEEALLQEFIEHDETIYDEIPAIENPFTGDAAKGYNAALDALAASLFGDAQGQKAKKISDPRLIPPPSSSNNAPNNLDSDKNKNTKSSDAQKGDKRQKAEISSLTQQELNELIDKVKAARDAAKDAIPDKQTKDNSDTDASKKQVVANALKDLTKEAEEAKTQFDANDIDARLKAIADFWNDSAVNKHKTDIQNVNSYKNMRKELRDQITRAQENARRRNYNYKPANISTIVANIVNTIKTQVADVRSSSWSRYNDRSTSLGYVSPGRFTDKAPNKKPKVVFYFDVSGSWSGNEEKISMGHRIEEALKKLDQEKKIELSCYYFGKDVHDIFTTKDWDNSDAPVPHAQELLDAKQLDNIIIMTDRDPDTSKKLKVPGYAWLLFYDTVSESFAKNISGVKGTSILMVEHKEDNK